MSKQNEENGFLSSFSVKGCAPNDETNKIPPKDLGSAFLINFKDGSGAFLNGLQSLSQSQNVAGNFYKDQNAFVFNQVNYDQDYTKKSGPETFHKDKGNILLTINLTEYSNVIDIRKIRGIILLLDDRPPQGSEENINANVSGSRFDLINTTCIINEPISINQYGDVKEEDASESANGPDLKCESDLDFMHEYGSVNESISFNYRKRVHVSNLFQNTSVNEKGEKEFKCPICAKIYYAPRLLQKHYKNEHDSSYKYKCPKCPQVYKMCNVLKNHMRREHFTRCEFCKNTFATVPEYKTHLKENHKEVNYNLCKPYFCEPCDKEFTSKDTYLRHLRGHGGILCNICAARFDSRAEFMTHEKIHPNKYFCEICNKGFKEKCSFRAHEGVHNDLSFFCHVCKQGFKLKGGLKQHMQTHRTSKIRHEKAQEADPEYKFVCPICWKRTNTKDELDMHTKRHKTKRHKCEICGAAFSRTMLLDNHILLNHTNEEIIMKQETIVEGL